MKLKWTTPTAQQDLKIKALTLIIVGLWLLLGGPGLLAMWLIPGTEDAPSFGKLDMQMMIAGGVMLPFGALLASWAWAKPDSGSRVMDWQLTEKKSGAIVLIGTGLFMLLNVPMWFAKWALPPGVEDAPFFDKANMTLMIGGGVMLVLGGLAARRAWARPN